jgi:hypothetical protein
LPQPLGEELRRGEQNYPCADLACAGKLRGSYGGVHRSVGCTFFDIVIAAVTACCRSATSKIASTAPTLFMTWIAPLCA